MTETPPLSRRKVAVFLGTRPEIIKLSPLVPHLQEAFDLVLVHSGQHYSYRLDAIFFEELQLPAANYTLNVGSGSHGQQTGRMLMEMEDVLLKEQPDAVLVQGDTNTTLAGALAATKLGVPVGHVEAGCRSFNRRMPEEVNRILVDHCATWLFAPDEAARRHLLNEGIHPDAVFLVGSTGIDACMRNVSLAGQHPIVGELGVTPGEYLVLTLHRAENTAAGTLPGMVRAINDLAQDWPIVFPIHPRTRKALGSSLTFHPNVQVIEPLGYLSMLQLLLKARAVLTDSGGVQEEAAALGVPALTLRQETEWTYLVEAGANVLLGNQFQTIVEGARAALEDERLEEMRSRAASLAGQGASKRIVSLLEKLLADDTTGA
jgi:UDP-N-acetylglucosamine 2-epimerase (non-hydrolysing)